MSRIFANSAPSAAPGAANSGRSPVIDCGYYIGGIRQPGEIEYAQALAEATTRDDAFVWLGLHEPALSDLSDIAAVFELDEFAVEDAAKGGQRAKLEQYGAMTFLVVRTARYIEHAELTETSEIVQTGDLMMFIGQHFVITVRHGEVGALGPVRAELDRQQDLLALGPWPVVYGILDKVVDTYIQITGRLEDDIDAVESQVFARNVSSRIARIYQLKREVLEFKRAVVPAQRPLAILAEARLPTTPKKIIRHFRDVHDHLVRTVEQVVSYDDLLNSILQARLAQVTVDQNNDLRKIAAWAAIAAVQTTIAGVYGMNFDYMPETRWRFGYGFALLLMFGALILMYRLFRRSGWL
ncbi:MAG TPA: magnesium and cobalt transport protein CorA [Jiangellales bacterium]|nr:magnesium and cobalt transport protein CorA [Jiangellales bacterium]